MIPPPRTGKPGRPKGPYKVPPEDLDHATVHKTREKGRVVKVDTMVVFGTIAAVLAAVAKSVYPGLALTAAGREA